MIHARCIFFYPLFVFIHLLVSIMDQLRQILFRCICPGISHCNRDRNVTLFIGKFNLRSDLPYDFFRFFGCLVFQNNHELIFPVKILSGAFSYLPQIYNAATIKKIIIRVTAVCIFFIIILSYNIFCHSGRYNCVSITAESFLIIP